MSESLGGVGYMRVPRCYQVKSKFIIVRSMVGIILYLCVLCTLYILYFSVDTQNT